MKLYELSQAWQSLLDEIEEQDGEVSDDMDARLEAIEEAWTVKAEGVAKVVQTLTAQAEIYGAEASRLSDRRASLMARAVWFKGYLMREMVARGIEKVAGTILSVARQRSNPGVRVTSEAAIPEAFWRVERSIVKQEILAALKAGQAVPGAELERGEHIRIR